MFADWSTALAHRAAVEAKPDESTGIWSSLKQAIQITAYHPQPNPKVISKKLGSRQGDYYVLKNTEEKTYLRLSASEYDIWCLMDGELSVQDLIVEHYMKTGTFAHNNVIHLVQQLLRNQMLTEKSVAAWSQVASRVQRRSWLQRVSAPARAILTQRLSIHGIDRWITKLYQWGGWIFFTRPAAALFILVSILGFFAYSRLISDSTYAILGENVFLSLTTIYILSIVPVVIHELGHALTVKHYGREVPRGGLLLYFGMPAAFVETTDIWMEPRKARLLVTWNGPFTGLILGGAAAIFMYLNPGSPINNLLLKFATFAYLTVFFNVNPLLKLDGYYLLSDALDVPRLRERSMAFVRQRFIKKMLRRDRFTRDELVFTIFGFLSLIWTVYAIYLAYSFWGGRIGEGIRIIFNSSAPLVTRLVNFLIVAATLSFILLIGLQLFRAVRTMIARYARSGNLENHHKLAVTLGAFSLLLGLGIPLLSGQFSLQIAAGVGLLLGLFAVLLLLRSSRSYFGSREGAALIAFSVGTVLSTLALTLRLVPDAGFTVDWSQWAALLVVSAGFVLITPGVYGWKTLALGVIAAALWFVLVGLVLPASPSLVFSLMSSLFLLAGVGAVRMLRGSARAPAVVLFTLGGLFITLSWIDVYPLFDPAFTGTLLVSAACIHLASARLPKLSSPGEVEITSDTRWSVGVSVGILIRRVIAQVFFESGFAGVERFGAQFNKSMQSNGVDIRVRGKVFYDNELPNRNTDELLEVYGLVFDVIYDYICMQFGRRTGTLTFGYGVDLLPWEYREVVSELILSRRQWGLSLSRKIADVQEKRLSLLRRVDLFSEASDEELEDLATAVQEEHYAKGEYVIRQGWAGDKFYIIEHGVATVWQRTTDGTDEIVDRLGARHYFGEVALISNASRNASIRAETPLALLSLERTAFDRLVKKHLNLEKQVNTRVGYSWLLRGMPVFDQLSGEDIDHLASNLQVERYPPNTEVFHQGDPGEKFYIVASGQLSVLHEVDGKQVEVSRRRPGDYFGEIALIEKRPRSATIMTIEESELLSMQSEDFQEVVSSFMHVGEALSTTGSRRLSMLQRVDAGVIPTS